MSNGAGRDPVLDLLDAQDLAFDTLKVARKGLVRNPSKDEKRRLLRLIARLEDEIKQIGDQIDALADQDDAYQGPTDAEMELVADLTKQVGGLTADNITAQNALQLAGKVLEAIGSLADA